MTFVKLSLGKLNSGPVRLVVIAGKSPTFSVSNFYKNGEVAVFSVTRFQRLPPPNNFVLSSSLSPSFQQGLFPCSNAANGAYLSEDLKFRSVFVNSDPFSVRLPRLRR